MAADVSSLIRLMKGYTVDDMTVVSDSAAPNSASLITRDLLGGSSFGSNHRDELQELDLEMEVPSGWEKRLDLKSGKLYLQRCNNPALENRGSVQGSYQTVGKLQDLNLSPTPSSRVTLKLFDEGGARYKSISSSPPSSTKSGSYQSVCTLDKVKSALSRAEKEPMKKRAAEPWKTSQSPTGREDDFKQDRLLGSVPVAAGCPGCLSYVLISTSSPRCPRCNSLVPLPVSKKPRIDLNISI